MIRLESENSCGRGMNGNEKKKLNNKKDYCKKRKEAKKDKQIVQFFFTGFYF